MGAPAKDDLFAIHSAMQPCLMGWKELRKPMLPEGGGEESAMQPDRALRLKLFLAIAALS
jgi:hypothetical protein